MTGVLPENMIFRDESLAITSGADPFMSTAPAHGGPYLIGTAKPHATGAVLDG